MDEMAARDLLLIQAIETMDPSRDILNDDDRKYASRSARELALWESADRRDVPEPALFLRHRAQLLLRKLVERQPAFASFIKHRSVLPWLSLILPVLAFLTGVGVDRVGNPHRVDLLSAPLILIIFWNLAVYTAMLVMLCMPRARSALPTRFIEFFSRQRTRVLRKLSAPLSRAMLTFAATWTQLGTRLATARLSRALHLAAACFALGAIASLYAKGVLSEYEAGWESTFLNTGQVHALLSALFAPAIAVFPLQGFSLQDIESLRFGRPATYTSAGARWVHLYAGTLFLLVVAPRLLLAALAHWLARKRQKNFPLDLQQPYFQRLLAGAGGSPGTLRVLPYSFTVDEARDRGLVKIAAALVGDQARLALRPSVAYGEDLRDALDDDGTQSGKITMTAALFNLAATPEPENHGAFLKQISRACKGKVMALVDVSGFQERVGTQAGGKSRMDERIALWKEFCRFYQVNATAVNLLSPESCMAAAGETP